MCVQFVWPIVLSIVILTRNFNSRSLRFEKRMECFGKFREKLKTLIYDILIYFFFLLAKVLSLKKKTFTWYCWIVDDPLDLSFEKNLNDWENFYEIFWEMNFLNVKNVNSFLFMTRINETFFIYFYICRGLLKLSLEHFHFFRN